MATLSIQLVFFRKYVITFYGMMFIIKTYESQEIAEGTYITVAYMDFKKDGKSLVYLLNEDSRLILKVIEINRGDMGEMVLLMTDKDGGEYTINPSGSMLELNMSEITPGDELVVYYQNGIMESWPMQVDTVLITR